MSGDGDTRPSKRRSSAEASGRTRSNKSSQKRAKKSSKLNDKDGEGSSHQSQSGGAFRGRGKSSGEANESTEQQGKKKKVPEALMAHQGWVEDSNEGAPYVIEFEDAFFNTMFGGRLKSTLSRAADRTEIALTSRGLDMTAANVFQFLLEPGLALVVDYTTQSLVSSNQAGTHAHELYSLLATLYLRSSMNMSTDTCWGILETLAATKGFDLMDLSRYKVLIQNLKGFPMDKRQARANEADTHSSWMR